MKTEKHHKPTHKLYRILSICLFMFCGLSAIPVPLSAQVVTDTITVPDIDSADLQAVMQWIESRVIIVKTPFCWRDSYTRDVGVVRSVCASGLEKDGALCYPKCGPGYTGVGPVCWQDCPSGFRDDGAFCAKTLTYTRGAGRIPDKKPCSDWNVAYRDDGTSCWLDTYGRGAGRVPDKKPCSDWNAAYRDDGTSCWLDTYGRGGGYDYFFKDGMADCEKVHGKGNCEMWGAVAYPKCKTGYRPAGCCLCEPIGGPGIKVTVFERYKCRPDEELNGGLCYPKCKAGYRAAGCCLCEPNAGVGIKVTAFERYKCRPDEELNGALCYPKCKPGTHAVGCCVCSQDCYADSAGDIGVSCAKKSYGRGEGEVLQCPPGYVPDGTGGPVGLCYKKCKAGYSGSGPVCWQNCTNGMVDCGAGCALDGAECGVSTFDQVIAPVILAANIATLGMSTPGTAALKAGQEVVKVGNKSIVVGSKVGKYFCKAVNLLQSTSKANLVQEGNIVKRVVKRVVNVRTGATISTAFTTLKTYKTANKAYHDYTEAFAEDFTHQTSIEINNEIDANFSRIGADYVKKSWGSIQLAQMATTENFVIAQTVLSAVSIVDISGVTGVVSAYTKPICGEDIPFPTMSRSYK